MTTNSTAINDDYFHHLPWLESLIPSNIRKLNDINDTVVTVLSTVLNFTLMTLILTERNVMLKAYSRVLLHNCTIDLVFTLASSITNLQIEFKDGYIIVIISNSWTRELQMPWHYIMQFIYGTSCTWAVHVAPVIFYFRYELMCKGNKLSIRRILTCSVIAIFFAALRYSFLTYSTFLNEPRRAELCSQLLDHPIFWEPGTLAPSPKCMAADASTIFLPIYLILAVLCDAVCYKAMMYFSYAIYKEMKVAQQKFSGKTARLQCQMNHLLMAQVMRRSVKFRNKKQRDNFMERSTREGVDCTDAILSQSFFRISLNMFLPFFTALVPASTIFLFTLFHINIPGAGLLTITLVSWIPLVSPLTTLVLVSNFREKLWRFLTASLRSKFAAENIGRNARQSTIAQLSTGSAVKSSVNENPTG